MEILYFKLKSTKNQISHVILYFKASKHLEISLGLKIGSTLAAQIPPFPMMSNIKVQRQMQF